MTPTTYIDAVLDSVANLPGYKPGDTIGFRFLTTNNFNPLEYAARFPGNSAEAVANRAAEFQRYLTGFQEFTVAQKDAVRQILAMIESVCGLRIIEVSENDPGPAYVCMT